MPPDNLGLLSVNELHERYAVAQKRVRWLRNTTGPAVIGACILSFVVGWGLLSPEFCAEFPVAAVVARLFCAGYCAGGAAIGGDRASRRLQSLINGSMTGLAAEIRSRDLSHGAVPDYSGAAPDAGIQKDFTASASVRTTDVITICKPLRFRAPAVSPPE